MSIAAKSSQGSGSHKVSDYWLYVNGQFQGIYPMGATLPIVHKGEQARIRVLAGIQNNGISTTRIWWPFYNPIDIDTNLPAGTTITMPMAFTYQENTTFAWMENFDDGIGLSLQRSASSDTSFVMAGPSDRFEGQSIELGLTPPAIVAQLETAGDGFALPAANANVYLEINYKCNNEFSVGLIDDELLARPILNINPRNEWNKIYIQLAQAVNTPRTSSRYKVYFRMVRSESQENPRLFLDNIKLVYL